MPRQLADQLAGQRDHASFARRLLAMAYEALLVLAVLAVTVVLPHLLIGAFSGRIASPALLWAHVFAILLVYFLWFWCRGGQTLAMKTWRIRLVGESGRPLRPVQALLRYLACWLSVGAGGAGIVWALVDRDRQFLHDRLAGTRLIRM